MDSDDRVNVFDKWDVLNNELHGLRSQSEGHDKQDALSMATWTQIRWQSECYDKWLTIKLYMDSDDIAKFMISEML